ncbi:Spy/CpxP family protein refolding chaperone [Ramlibacter alkalitolerans]|uniref:Spy/CpxP family protein refolding chaperone n=1 Tax=Ramlibacter alkalitolerans TaxID=2039631 RepID=A0ABS1JN94_9BURK|nr:Spy/CpxP family protein refolding chaperone [Ramlibacter alkalitolerans]MBL0425727.1 Spy/CpxP family protein refolding chaperone [Ramlibacter alkalitolerans]
MKPWIRRSLAGLFAVLTLGALAGCGHHRDHAAWGASAEDQARHRAHVVDRVAARLELDEAQKDKLAVLVEKLQAQRTALAGQPDPRAQFQALVAGDKFDRAGAQALLQKAASALETRSPEVIAALGDFYDSLDARQQARVREFLQHRRGWWRRG